MRSLVLVLAACTSEPTPKPAKVPTRFVVHDTLLRADHAWGELVKSEPVRLVNDCTIRGIAGVIVLSCPATDLVLELECGEHEMTITGVTYTIRCQ